MAKEICEKLMLVLVALVLLFVQGAATAAGMKTLTNLEIRKELKRLNKPAIKTIKSEDGEIIDCVDIYKQPAFDHPLLKNHTIQMRPSFYDSTKISSSKPLEQLWHKSGSCPKGTIPIRRTRKEDLLRDISFGRKINLPSQLDHAKMVTEVENHGAQAKISVWNVHVEEDEHSTASIFVRQKDKFDLVNAGWIVSDYIMGDNNTHLYAYWGSDTDGCYNLKCPGFVQINNGIALGSVIPVSVYDGNQQTLELRISMDPANNNWWLVVGLDTLGYWPSSLFKDMVGRADRIEWSGEVLNLETDDHHTTTQMGSGHFAGAGKGRAAFFDNCMYLVKHDEGQRPHVVTTSVTRSKCYDMSKISMGSRDKGLFFYFGGPGGPTCDVV
ncbi:hypothetical protein AAC387_Pa02g0927 [Persea americana]